MTTPLERLKTSLADRYRIERELGAGGMATVYLAEDLKHHRRVAVKVLHPDLSAILGPDRFHKEIELTAALQHPHILPLFDSGAADGLLYYVMPYVEGETLRTRLTRDVQLSVPEAVRIASEVADALEYAHRHSVVHRDIKPENILLRDHHALVMDFGIALAVAQAGDRLTQTGTSLGTPQYMAPEQASGDRHIDGRADVYALGVVTYEMLVGEPPFTGPTVQAIMAKVMTEEPRPIGVTRRTVPDQVEAAVLTALQKVPADRFATPGEFQRALTGTVPVTVRTTRAQTAPAAPPRRLLWTGATALVGVAAYFLGSRGPSTPVARFGLATKVTWEHGLEIEPALSPDGKSVAYAAGTSQRMQIYVRQVAGGRPIQLTGDGAVSQTNPQWSADGTRIYFVTDSGLSSAPAAGGGARPEMRTPGGQVVSAAISPDGSMIVFAVGDSLYLHRPNGENRFLAPVREASLCHWAPSGQVIACASGNAFYSQLGHLYGNIASSRIVTIHLPEGSVTAVTDSLWTNQSPAWSADGRWLYYVSNRLGMLDIYAAPVSRDGKPTGAALRLTTGLGAHEISVSRSGTRIAYDQLTAAANLWMMPFPPRSAAEGVPLTSGSQVIESMDATPDGHWVYYNSDVSGRSEIYRMRLNPLITTFGPPEPEQVTFDSIDDFAPSPSPDGRSVAFHSFKAGSRDIYVLPLDGGPVQQVTNSPRQEGQASWSPDGHAIAFTEYGVTGAVAVAADTVGGWRNPVRISPYGAWPRFSPDGRSIAFASNTLGGSLVVIGPGPANHRVVVDSAAGHLVEALRWSPDGQTLYFKSHDSQGRAEFWSVPRAGGAPKLLVRLGLDRPSDRPEWALGKGRMFFAVNDRQSDIWVMEALPR